MIPFHSILEMGAAAHHERLRELAGKLQFDDPINIQFTSGTTGAPKGATLTHHNILNNGFFIGEAMKLTPQDKLCIPVPLYHCFGMVLGNLACTTHGTAMVYPGEGFDPLATRQRNAAPACMACPPCSSRKWNTRNSQALTFHRCARASWPARPARLK
jgi:fatty-acyl-CoA synthase